MPIDTGIYNLLGRGVKSVSDFDNDHQAQQLNALMTQERAQNLLTGKMKQDEYTRGVREAETIRGALAGLGGDATDDARIKALKSTGLPGGFSQADALQKAMLERDKTRATVGKDEAQTAGYKLDQSIKAHEFHVQQLANVADPQTAAAWVQEGIRTGVFTPEQAQRGMANLQQASQSPQTFAAWRQQALQGGASATEQLKMQAEQVKQAEQVRQFGVTSAETQRSHQASEKNAAGHLGVAQANLGPSRERLNQEKAAPKGVIVQTDAGPVLTDPRTGQSIPLTGPDGATLGPKLKDAPAAVQKAMIENGTNLRRAERALALVQGTDVGEAKGDKAATGLKGYLPNQILNRIDPTGVDARAQIADLGSLVIHDRSGAAVTASEFPRLAPFIPTEKDDNASAQKKLKRFVQVYKEEIEATQQAYGPGSGFRQLGGKTPDAPKPGGVVDFGSLK